MSGGDFGFFGFGPGGDYTYIAANLPLIDSQPTGQHVVDVITQVNGDGHGGTATETLTITIDRLPIAQNDTDTAVAGATITGAASVLANDTDPDGDALTITSTGKLHRRLWQAVARGRRHIQLHGRRYGGDRRRRARHASRSTCLPTRRATAWAAAPAPR